MMRLRVTAGDALRGRAQRKWEARRRVLQRSVHAGVKETGDAAKSEWRAAVQGAGLGRRLANTIRSQTYPERGFSASAAASVWTRAPHIIDALTRGETIRSPIGALFAIPTENLTMRLPRFGKVQAAERRFGKLDFVPLRGGGPAVAMLVAGGLQRSRGKRGGFRKASARTLRLKQDERVPLFWLTRETRPRKRLPDPRAIGRRQMRRLGVRIKRQMKRLESTVKA